jgi:DNA invertase Pin-like site-specific DNA recombinase
MILEMLAAISRKDYEDRRRRQMQGIAKAKKAGLYKGRPKNENLRATIKAHLNECRSYNDIVRITGCSKATISKVKKAALEATN